MDKANLYERLVAQCEQYDIHSRDADMIKSRINSLVREIDTMEAVLIVAAFKQREELQNKLAKIRNVLA